MEKKTYSDTFSVTESQNHLGKGPLEMIYSILLAQAGSAGAGCPRPAGFWCFHKWRCLLVFSWNLNVNAFIFLSLPKFHLCKFSIIQIEYVNPLPSHLFFFFWETFPRKYCHLLQSGFWYCWLHMWCSLESTAASSGFIQGSLVHSPCGNFHIIIKLGFCSEGLCSGDSNVLVRSCHQLKSPQWNKVQNADTWPSVKLC